MGGSMAQARSAHPLGRRSARSVLVAAVAVAATWLPRNSASMAPSCAAARPDGPAGPPACEVQHHGHRPLAPPPLWFLHSMLSIVNF